MKQILWVLVIILGFSLGACTPSKPEAVQPTQPIATKAEVITTPEISPTTEEPIQLTPTLEPTNPPVEVSGVSFSASVLPLLQSRCVNCHGGERTSEGLDLTTYEKLMAGSDFSAVVLAGDASQSLLVTLVQEGKMPKRGSKLTPAQVQLLVDWVNQGALNN